MYLTCLLARCCREFLALLEKHTYDAVEVAQCFLDRQQDFIIYSDYCTNFPRYVLGSVFFFRSFLSELTLPSS